jgi:hypothetical protein
VSWFKVDDAFHSSKPVLKIPRKYRLAAIGLWTSAGTWCAQEESDGFLPDWVLEELCGTKAIARHLVSAGLWIEVKADLEDSSSVSDGSSSVSGESGWQFKNWSKYQPTREELDEKREKDRIRQANYRASRRDNTVTTDGLTEGQHHESDTPDPTRPDPTPKEEAKASSSEAREDVEHLCTVLADLVQANGSLRPKITKTWTDECRRMIDLDGREPAKAENLIRWAQGNIFWRKNILSMTTFRAKYDQLRLAAVEDWEKNKTGPSPDGLIDVDAILGRDVWAPGTPPAGLGMAEEIEWKKQQRAAHKAERMEEAKRKLGVAA